MMDNHHFTSIIAELFSSQTLAEEVAAAKALKVVYFDLLEQFDLQQCCYDATRIVVAGGVALSPKHALDCLDDPLRTVRFIKGTALAVEQALEQFPHCPIEILYAGCGPVAPLLLPLLLTSFSHLEPTRLDITLLDIHQSSMDTVKSLAGHLGLAGVINRFVVADAVHYRHPQGGKWQLVISETMDKGLTKEPQVRVMQNLAAQLHEQGIFVPVEIRLFTKHCCFATLPLMQTEPSAVTDEPMLNWQWLFTLDRTINNDVPFAYISDWKTTPSQQNLDIVVCAEVVIYADCQLSLAQSLVSNPFKVTGSNQIEAMQYQLCYDCVYGSENLPQWYISNQNSNHHQQQ